MRILGIDPGTGKVGYGLIEVENSNLDLVDYGCIKAKPEMVIADRLSLIFNKVQDLIKEFKPDVVAVEKLFFARNVTTVMSVGEARGVIILAANLNNKQIEECTPLQAKQAITGYGRAEKGQIQRMVQKILKMDKPPRPDDAADALAVAITCSNCIKKVP